jgi:hypothetical protein
VAGAFLLLLTTTIVLFALNPTNRAVKFVGYTLCALHLIWVIVGAVFVFAMRQPKESECSHEAYLFALVSIAISLALLLLAIGVLSCIILLCIFFINGGYTYKRVTTCSVNKVSNQGSRLLY